jgi:hypothetical protein
VLVEPEICKSGAPTQDGSKCSNTKMDTSLIQLTTKSLMLLDLKTRKVLLLLCTIEMVITLTMLTKNGKSSILTKLLQLEPRVSTRNLDSTSTDHSISDQDFHSRELLNATELTMSGSRDGERMLPLNNGILMVSPRLSRTTNGRATHLIFNQMEHQTT